MLLLTACSDYDLTPKPKDGEEVEDTGAGTSTDTGVAPPGDECPDPNEDATTVAIDESCVVEAIVGTFTPVIEWQNAMVGNAYVTPVVGHLNDDDGDGRVTGADMPDIVVVNTAGAITALSGDGSAQHWRATISGSEPGTPAIGDLDGDGFGDVVLSAGSGTTMAISGPTGATLWSRNVSQIGNRAICGAASIYDLDGDGAAEAVFGNVILDGATGALRGVGPLGAGTGYSGSAYASMGVAADIDQDGQQEVVVGNALYDADGNVEWSTSQADGWVAVANFDSDPEGEIVVAWYPGRLRLQDDDGAPIWVGTYTGSTIGPPTIADFDNDGEPEIGVAGQSEYVVVDTDGRELWSVRTQDASSGFTGSAVFDFEGDGQAEAVYADEVSLWVFDGATGRVKLEEPAHSSLTCSESPAIADVDNDGHAEILYTSYAYTDGTTGLTVVGDADNSWRPARGVWNQHSYAITNVNDDASIPSAPATNWHTYNNFRSGDLSAATGGALADAVPGDWGLCVNECDDGRLYVTVRVGNGGVESMPAGIPWTLYSEASGVRTAVATGETTTELASGASSTGTTVELTPDQVPEGVLYLVVDDREGFGVLSECHEDNNTMRLDVEGC